ncbi:MAG: hypothetical protein R2911_20240 [Caldilineaceae bacterium]
MALEGRPAPPHQQWNTQVQVNLADLVSGEVRYSFNTTTTANGDFSTRLSNRVAILWL